MFSCSFKKRINFLLKSVLTAISKFTMGGKRHSMSYRLVRTQMTEMNQEKQMYFEVSAK